MNAGDGSSRRVRSDLETSPQEVGWATLGRRVPTIAAREEASPLREPPR